MIMIMIMRSDTNMILVLIILLFSSNTFANTLSPNQTLSGNQTIISAGGNFELVGFFTPAKSSKHYLGIWYKKLAEHTVIWVANREAPISDYNSAHLKISQGNLILLNESQIKIWSTDLNSTDSNSSISAELLDDGNLVLRQGFDEEWEMNDFSSGCVREDILECGNGERREDKFMTSSNMGLPQHSQLLRVESRRSECESACKSDCSCEAYAYGGGGCSLWNGGLLNLQRVSERNSSGRTIYIRLSAYSSVFRGEKNDRGVVIGAIVGCFCFVMVLAVMAGLWRSRRHSIATHKVVDGSLVAFKYKDVQNATKNFTDS